MTNETTAKKPAPIAKAQPAAKPKKNKDAPFTPKAGTKRAVAFEALTRKQGCTLAQATELLGWARGVCGSEFSQIATLAKRKLVREGEVYKLV